jgi:hypothetical protein
MVDSVHLLVYGGFDGDRALNDAFVLNLGTYT